MHHALASAFCIKLHFLFTSDGGRYNCGMANNEKHELENDTQPHTGYEPIPGGPIDYDGLADDVLRRYPVIMKRLAE